MVRYYLLVCLYQRFLLHVINDCFVISDFKLNMGIVSVDAYNSIGFCSLLPPMPRPQIEPEPLCYLFVNIRLLIKADLLYEYDRYFV